MFSRRDSIDTQNIKKELASTLKNLESKMTSVENTINSVEGKMTGVETKIVSVEDLLTSVESNISILDDNLSKELEDKIKLTNAELSERISIIESDVPYIKQLTNNTHESYNNLEKEVYDIKQQIEQIRIDYEKEIKDLREFSINTRIDTEDIQMYTSEDENNMEETNSPESPKLRRWSLFN